MLWKGVYSYEYMNDLEKLNETSLSEKGDFYGHLNMEDITDADYAHAKRVWNKKRMSWFSWFVCHDLYVQSDTLLLADVFQNSGNMFLEVYELDPAHFLSAPRLVW